MRHLIIGNGIAGITAASTLRKRDSAAQIVVLSQEPYHFYSRVRLVEFLAGQATERDLICFKDDWYQRQRIDVRLGVQASRLDPAQRQVSLSNGEVMQYDKLLLATGGLPWVPAIPGIENQPVFTLRTLEDAKRIKEHAARAKSILVLGAGLLGIETAAALLAPDKQVTLVESCPRLLPRQTDNQGSAVLRQALESLGLKFVLQTRVSRAEQNSGKLNLVLEDGRRVAGEMLVVSAGIGPNGALARAADLKTNCGVLVNDLLETSAPHIYAAGDLAEHRGVMYGILAAAERQGKVAAINMSGGAEQYQGTVFSTTLKVAGINLISMGEIDQDGQQASMVQCEPEKGLYRKVVLKDDLPIGCILLGSMDGKKEIMAAIQNRQPWSMLREKLAELGLFSP